MIPSEACQIVAALRTQHSVREICGVLGFMSATLNETMFRRAMDNRRIKRGDLRTNRNPRATAYTPKAERVDEDLLSAPGEFYFGLVSDDLKKPNRGLVNCAFRYVYGFR